MNKSFFSLRLKQALDNSVMKASDLCRLCDISKSTMSQYLSGKYTAKHDRIIVMARVLGCSPDWLAGNDVPMNPSLADTGMTGLVPVLLPDASNLYEPDLTSDYESADKLFCDGNHLAFVAGDDSMDPVIMEGDHVLFVRQNTLDNGQTGLFLIHGSQVVIRELQCTPTGKKLVCSNRYYPPFAIDGSRDVQVIGRVVRSTRYWQ